MARQYGGSNPNRVQFNLNESVAIEAELAQYIQSHGARSGIAKTLLIEAYRARMNGGVTFVAPTTQTQTDPLIESLSSLLT